MPSQARLLGFELESLPFYENAFTYSATLPDVSVIV